MFWSNLIAAVQAVVPDAGSEALSLLQAGESALQAVTASLLNDLEAFATDLVVVLDDYHFIESTDVHESLAFVLEHLPPQVHFVIASRVDPALPLARMRARGELLEVRVPPTSASPRTKRRPTSGTRWGSISTPAKSARSKRGRRAGSPRCSWRRCRCRAATNIADFIANFTGDDRFVVDYLVEEVLERQSDDVREFLLDTSILTSMTGSLCDAVTGGSVGRATLETLERANLFVVSLDDRRAWYRYHHLFARRAPRAARSTNTPSVFTNFTGGRATGTTRTTTRWRRSRTPSRARTSNARPSVVELAAQMLDRTRQEAALRRWLEALPDRRAPGETCAQRRPCRRPPEVR